MRPATRPLSHAETIAWVRPTRTTRLGAVTFARLVAEHHDQDEALESLHARHLAIARGVDTRAHEPSLETGTVAVLGGGLDQPYPPENGPLHNAIAETGLLVPGDPLGHAPCAREPSPPQRDQRQDQRGGRRDGGFRPVGGADDGGCGGGSGPGGDGGARMAPQPPRSQRQPAISRRRRPDRGCRGRLGCARRSATPELCRTGPAAIGGAVVGCGGAGRAGSVADADAPERHCQGRRRPGGGRRGGPGRTGTKGSGPV